MVFLLVVFFMLSSNFITTELMQLNVSSLEDGRGQGEENILRVLVRDEARVSVNGRYLTHREFSKLIPKIASDFPEKTLIVRAHKEARIQGFVTIMDIIYTSGIRNVTITQ